MSVFLFVVVFRVGEGLAIHCSCRRTKCLNGLILSEINSDLEQARRPNP
jgi:hypothetical protein